MIKKILSFIVMTAAFTLVSIGIMLAVKDYRTGVSVHTEQESLAMLAGRSSEPSETPVNFTKLSEVNRDVIGWLTIDGTRINYPIVQGKDNQVYLNTGFDGEESVYGSIFLDYECKPDLTGKHIIIYGHNMKDGAMFQDLVKFKNEKFFRTNRYITLYLPDRKVHLRTLAALYTGSGGIRRQTIFESEKAFDSYVDKMTRDCPFREMPEAGIDRLYSFITCSYEFNDARTVLYAYEVPGDTKSLDP